MNDLKPFRFWCQKVLPLVYDDSLSYYELLCKVVEYLNNTISDVNKLSEEFQTLYNYVHDYFDGLDVQEEINKKLDAMVSSGELDTIFAKYFSLKLYVDNVESLSSITKTVVGTYYETLNYYNNDNINALFKVTDTAENFTSIPTYDGHYFTNVSEKFVKKYGVYKNRNTNTNILNNMLTTFGCAFFDTDEYSFDVINLPRNVSIDFNNSKIHCTNIIINNTPRNDEDLPAYIKNAILDCSGNVGISMTNALRFTLDNIMFIGFKTAIHFISGYECLFKNIRAIGNNSEQIGIKINGGDSHFYDIQMLNVYKAIELNSGINFFTNVHCWLLDSSLFSGSKMIEDNTPGGSWNYFERVYFDTYNYGLYKTGVSTTKLSNVVVLCDESLATTANYYMTYNTGSNKNIIIDSIEFRIAVINSKLLLSNKPGVMSISYPGVHPSDYYSELYKLLTCSYTTPDYVKVNSGRVLCINNMLHITFDIEVTGNTADTPILTIDDVFINPFSDTIPITASGTPIDVILQGRGNTIKIRANGNFNAQFNICVPCVIV